MDLYSKIWVFWHDGAWSQPERVCSLCGQSCGPVIIDEQDNLHLFWTSSAPHHLWYSSFNGTFWSTPLKISIALHGNSIDPDVVIKGNYIHVMWPNWPVPGEDTANIYYSHRELTGIEDEKLVGEKVSFSLILLVSKQKFIII